VEFGDFSAELCGGTHVRATAEVGLFRLVSEASIGSGVRRIEAVTGDAAVAYTLERDKLLKDLAARLRVSVDQLPQRVEALAARAGRPGHTRVAAEALAGAVRAAPDGQRYVIASDPGIELASLARAATRLSRELDAVVVLLLPDESSGSLRVGVSVPAAAARAGRLDARTVLRQVLAVTGGRGGGSAAFAQGGGAEAGDSREIVARLRSAFGLQGENEPAP
jgi:alanyl-tRNA synthetase